MRRQKPRQRGGRVPDKATPEQVMGLGAQPAVDARRAREGPGGRHARPARLPGQPVREGEREPGRIQTAAAARTGRVPPQSKTLEGRILVVVATPEV